MYDLTSGLNNADKIILDFIKDKKHIIIANKCDVSKDRPKDAICISAKTEAGINELKQKIKEIILEFSPEDTEFVTNKRQQDCLEKAKESLMQAYLASKVNELQDLISIDVKQALLCLDEITGEVITDDILNNIFDNFCIGK